MENYFAKFLCKQTQRPSAARATQRNGKSSSSSQANSAMTLDSFFAPSTPPPPPSPRANHTALNDDIEEQSLSDRQGHHHHHHPPGAVSSHSSPSSSSLPTSSPLFVAQSDAHRNSRMGTSSFSSAAPQCGDETTNVASSSFPPARRMMNDDDEEEEERRLLRIQGVSSSRPAERAPPPQRRRVETAAPAAVEDDDEDLALLLGSQEARRQKQQRHEEAALASASSATTTSGTGGAGRTTTTVGRHVGFPVNDSVYGSPIVPSPVAIRTLPWDSHRRHDLKRVVYLFQLQLEAELLLDSVLFDAFHPFLKDRFVEKVRRSRQAATVMGGRSSASPVSASVAAAALPHPALLSPEILEETMHYGGLSSSSDDDHDDNENDNDAPDAAAGGGGGSSGAVLRNPYRRRIPPFPLFEAAPAVISPEMANPAPASSSIGGQNGTVSSASSFVLRPYQLEGVGFLLNHFHRGLSCVLSDDMGLGKTAQVSAFLHVLASYHGIHGPHLIVCPLTTLTNWVRELSRWAPELKVVKYHGGKAERSRQQMDHRHTGVVVTTPAILNQDKSFFLRRPWVSVIVDEAHVLKNQNTRITSISRKLTTVFRVAVTGTPIQNDTREVWSILGFLFPSVVVRDGCFDGSDPAEEAEACAAVLTHLMLRRTKGQLLLGIPPRIDHPVTLLEPTFVQSELLSLMTSGVLNDGENSGSMQGHLTHQRMVCSHPRALQLTSSDQAARQHLEGAGSSDQGADAVPITARLAAAGIPLTEESIILPSAKMRYLDAELPRLRAEGHRCLIFSNFASVLDLLEGMCVLRGFSYERLDGTCNRVERELSLLRYNNSSSSCFLFLITTPAGGVGITLTGADTVFLFDANFNPQLDRQAADRAHRIGQTREVHVYRLCLQNTIEEYIREVAEYKATLGDMIVNASGGGGVDSPTSPSSPNQLRSSTTLQSNSLSGQEIRRMFERLQERRQQRVEQQQQQQQQQLQQHAAAVGAASSHEHSEVVDVDVDVDDVVVLGVGRDMNNAHHNLQQSEGGSKNAELALVHQLLAIEHGGDSERRGPKQRGRATGGMNQVRSTNVCFVCGEKMHKMEPLYHCVVCPKAYHADCIGEKRPKPGFSAPRHWSCPRHRCVLCDKAQAGDGAIFMCESCPRAFCFDCLPAFFLELDEKGQALRHVRRTYEGMEVEEMEVRRSCYYIQCLRCAGVEESSSEEEDSEEDNEDDEEDSDDDTVSDDDDVTEIDD